MRKRYFISAGIVAASFGLAFAFLVAMPLCPGVTEANVNRIDEGMTLEEVQAIMGRSPDGDFRFRHGTDDGIRSPMWRNSDGSCAVVILRNGTVVCAHWHDSTETITQKICRWLDWIGLDNQPSVYAFPSPRLQILSTSQRIIE
jgi:hypothetical protein